MKTQEELEKELEECYVILKTPENITSTQALMYLVIHLFLMIVFPLLILDRVFDNEIWELIAGLTYVLLSPGISHIIQTHITSKIFKLLIKRDV